MFIKNLTKSDLIFDAKGSKIALKAEDTTLIPDGLITIEELQKLFGKTAVIEDTTGPATSVLINQQVVETGKLYAVGNNAELKARLFVGVDGSVDIYKSDSTTIPTAFTDMACTDDDKAISGFYLFSFIPRYIAFKTKSGAPELVITNCKLYEVSDIS